VRTSARRCTALVARGVEPSEVFDAVTDEMRRSVRAITAGLWRFETSAEITLVAAAADPAALAKWPVGTRTPIEGDTLAAVIQRTGRAARIDTYENIAGPVAARVREVGVRAAVGVPIIVDGRVRGLVAVGSGSGPMPTDTEARITGFAELVATGLVAGYRDQQKRQMLGEASQRPSLIDSLLEGRVLDRWSLWEVASYLRLPSAGPFVVVAAEVSGAGNEALPNVESKLRSLDVYSAWRLLPDVKIGIVHVASDQQLNKVLALVSRVAAGLVLDCFADLPKRSGRSSSKRFGCGRTMTRRCAAPPNYCFCHPNTVRHRLRRIEKRTGRSLSRPRDVAELRLAFEVHRRLM
jgi:hypothetical protein